MSRTKHRVDWEAISEYLKEVGKGSRARRDTMATDSLAELDAERVRRFRARSSHLVKRLPSGSVAKAAWGGLQDSAPRAALLSLHARVNGVTPESWSHDDLVQIWFRWADYVVPRSDVDVFTLGALPREPAFARALIDFGAAIEKVMDGKERSPNDVARAFLPDIPQSLIIRAASVSGLFNILWDARTTTLVPAPRPKTDPEEARLELGRRYLHWLGAGTAEGLARWAGLTRSDADETWAALLKELQTISVEGHTRSVLASDVDKVLAAQPLSGVRLLPQGDPYLYPDKVVTQAEPKIESPNVPRRLLNSLTGRVLFDGTLVGSWGRRQNKVTIAPWQTPKQTTRQLIQAEAESFAVPIGKPINVRWIDYGEHE